MDDTDKTANAKLLPSYTARQNSTTSTLPPARRALSPAPPSLPPSLTTADHAPREHSRGVHSRTGAFSHHNGTVHSRTVPFPGRRTPPRYDRRRVFSQHCVLAVRGLLCAAWSGATVFPLQRRRKRGFLRRRSRVLLAPPAPAAGGRGGRAGGGHDVGFRPAGGQFFSGFCQRRGAGGGGAQPGLRATAIVLWSWCGACADEVLNIVFIFLRVSSYWWTTGEKPKQVFVNSEQSGGTVYVEVLTMC